MPKRGWLISELLKELTNIEEQARAMIQDEEHEIEVILQRKQICLDTIKKFYEFTKGFYNLPSQVLN